MKRILFCILSVLLVSNLYAKDVVVKKENKTKDGIPYSITITLKQLENKMLYSDIERYKLFQPGECEPGTNQIITDMKVKYNGKEYQVPLSAYCDLYEVHEGYFKDMPIESGFILNIYSIAKGIDIKYYFINGQLIRRELEEIEMDEIKAWEATYYPMDDLEEDEPAKENNPTKK